MGVKTGIAWTHHTFNPWIGCTKIDQECKNCYAEAYDRAFGGGGHWGPGAPRRVTSAANWREPHKWNRAAAAAGERRRAFCASLADVFDAEAPAGMREQLWALIRQTPNLDWLILTKRPERIRECLPDDWGRGYPNVWLGTSVGYTGSYDRIDELCKVPAVVRFLSCEPLLEEIDLSPYLDLTAAEEAEAWRRSEDAPFTPADRRDAFPKIDWVIVGGESGAGSRPCVIDWIRLVVAQCLTAGVPVFVKQLGERPAMYEEAWREMAQHGPAPLLSAKGRDLEPQGLVQLSIGDRKGGAVEEWPPDLRVRQFPEPRK